eukprot:TRINITY_DN1506_c0_g1_i2.p1 TRINITY_DN1506_c0_g1~~TRINITY_DN1506_c0_g1_i2.p1  ORF type:complete len:263 (-),score=39.15 TRINITY_DN1506_c0_g1_i2:298-990(-)
MAASEQLSDGIKRTGSTSVDEKPSAGAVESLLAKATEEEWERKPLIALLAHDDMRSLLATFVKCYADRLAWFRLIGDETTCRMLRSVGLTPEKSEVPTGPLGGAQVLGCRISEGAIKALFFFRDPLSAHVHSADGIALGRLADVYQIYMATNYRGAAALLESMHCKMQRNSKLPAGRQGGSSIIVPSHLMDLGSVVQQEYKARDARRIAILFENDCGDENDCEADGDYSV